MNDNVLYHSLPGLAKLGVQSEGYRNESIREEFPISTFREPAQHAYVKAERVQVRIVGSAY